MRAKPGKSRMPPQGTMLSTYDGDHAYHHCALEPANRPHFTRDDVPLGVILDDPRRTRSTRQ